MTEDEILQRAVEACRQLKEQVEEANLQRERILQTKRLFSALSDFTRVFRGFGITLTILEIVRFFFNVVAEIYPIYEIRIINEFVFDILPARGPLLLGLSLYVAGIVFSKILQFISDGYLLPEENLLKELDIEVGEAKEVLTALQSSLNIAPWPQTLDIPDKVVGGFGFM